MHILQSLDEVFNICQVELADSDIQVFPIFVDSLIVLSILETGVLRPPVLIVE